MTLTDLLHWNSFETQFWLQTLWCGTNFKEMNCKAGKNLSRRKMHKFFSSSKEQTEKEFKSKIERLVKHENNLKATPLIKLSI